ncbi:MAG: rRNA pseudouridine synthase [Alicyclobacillaceae bacterium]|nr:rRNA pseudouridine synthase [Alicyclobacillaceae bacterium]
MEERLQKIIAAAGLTSRRKAEEWIIQGRVRVNGEIVRELGRRADPSVDRIEVDGRLLSGGERKVYYIFHKPRGVVTTLYDPQGRKTVADFFRHVPERVFPVGRLDLETSGLLVVTNDGALAHALMHPRFGVKKTYRVTVSGFLSDVAAKHLEEGVLLEDGMTAPAKVAIRRRSPERSEFDLTIHEGRNRQVRRMCKAVGHPVLKLVRIRYGNLTLDGLQPGESRPLTPEEQTRLMNLVRVKTPFQ